MIELVRLLVNGLFNPFIRPLLLGVAGVVCLAYGHFLGQEAAAYRQGPIQATPEQVRAYKSGYNYVRVEGVAYPLFVHRHVERRRSADSDALYYPVFDPREIVLAKEEGRRPRPFGVVEQGIQGTGCIAQKNCFQAGLQSFTAKVTRDAVPAGLASNFSEYFDLRGSYPVLQAGWQPVSAGSSGAWRWAGVGLLLLTGLSALLTLLGSQRAVSNAQRAQAYAAHRARSPKVAPLNWDDSFDKTRGGG